MSSSVAASPWHGIARLRRGEPAGLVESKNVIRVSVREDDRVHAAEVVGQRLLAKVGPGVDEDDVPSSNST